MKHKCCKVAEFGKKNTRVGRRAEHAHRLAVHRSMDGLSAGERKGACWLSNVCEYRAETGPPQGDRVAAWLPRSEHRAKWPVPVAPKPLAAAATFGGQIGAVMDARGHDRQSPIDAPDSLLRNA